MPLREIYLNVQRTDCPIWWMGSTNYELSLEL